MQAKRRGRRPAAADELTLALNALRALVNALGASARTVERTTGLTNAQLFLLRQVVGARRATIGELTERVRTKQAAVSLLVARLVREGLVEKARSDDDSRRVVVTPTAAGRRLAARAPTSPTDRLVAALDALPRRDVTTLAAGLSALAGAMGLDTRSPALLFEPRR